MFYLGSYQNSERHRSGITSSRATSASRPVRRPCRRAGLIRPIQCRLRHDGPCLQTVLPFNAFWDKSPLHPDGASTCLSAMTWASTGSRGTRPGFEQSRTPPQALGHVEDSSGVAVNTSSQPLPGPCLRGLSVFDASDQDSHGGLPRPRRELRQGVTISRRPGRPGRTTSCRR